MIKIESVRIKLNRTRYLSGTFNLPSSGLVHLQGENGSGKSTFLKALSGFRPFSGKIVIDGEIYNRFSCLKFRKLRTRMKYVSPVPISGFKGLCFNDVLNNCEMDEETKQLSDILNLPLNTPYERLSSGELSMFHLLYALMLQPDIILIDEALSSLKDEVSREVLVFLSQLKDRLVIICSQKELATNLIEYALKIDHGKIIPAYTYEDEEQSIMSRKSAKNPVGILLSRRTPFKLRMIIPHIVSVFSIFLLTSLVYNDNYHTFQNEAKNYSVVTNVDPCYGKGDTTHYRTYFYYGEARVEFYYHKKVGQISTAAVNLFKGNNLDERLTNSKGFFKSYFDIDINGVNDEKKFSDGRGFSYYVTISLDQFQMIQKRVTSDGLYLRNYTELLSATHSFTPVKEEKIEDLIATTERPIITSKEFKEEDSKRHGEFNHIGEYQLEKPEDAPIYAYTTEECIVEYARENRFAYRTEEDIKYRWKLIDYVHHLDNPARYSGRIGGLAGLQAMTTPPEYFLFLLPIFLLTAIIRYFYSFRKKQDDLGIINGVSYSKMTITSCLLDIASLAFLTIVALLPIGLLAIIPLRIGILPFFIFIPFYILFLLIAKFAQLIFQKRKI